MRVGWGDWLPAAPAYALAKSKRLLPRKQRASTVLRDLGFTYNPNWVKGLLSDLGA